MTSRSAVPETTSMHDRCLRRKHRLGHKAYRLRHTGSFVLLRPASLRRLEKTPARSTNRERSVQPPPRCSSSAISFPWTPPPMHSHFRKRRHLTSLTRLLPIFNGAAPAPITGTGPALSFCNPPRAVIGRTARRALRAPAVDPAPPRGGEGPRSERSRQPRERSLMLPIPVPHSSPFFIARPVP